MIRSLKRFEGFTVNDIIKRKCNSASGLPRRMTQIFSLHNRWIWSISGMSLEKKLKIINYVNSKV
jgi:hypothetical protein